MRIKLAVLLLTSLLLLVSCTSSFQNPFPQENLPLPIPLEKYCSTAEDCVKAQCCHATDAVNKAYAPDCSDVFCTMECAAGTLDCGQGEMQCLQGTCTAVINE